MIVFDVDETLIGGESTDWASFENAFAEVAGFELSEAFFASLQEVTAKAIVAQALVNHPHLDVSRTEQAVRKAYLRNLQAAHRNNPACFTPAVGAVDLLRKLHDTGARVAIATGDWLETILFKLRCAGIPVEGIPMVTSSDFYSRAEIIAAAVQKAGGCLADAIYVGDGLWDWRACQQLGIPFIGVGTRRDRLQSAGVPHVLPDLTPSGFLPVRQRLNHRATAGLMSSTSTQPESGLPKAFEQP